MSGDGAGDRGEIEAGQDLLEEIVDASDVAQFDTEHGTEVGKRCGSKIAVHIDTQASTSCQ